MIKRFLVGALLAGAVALAPTHTVSAQQSGGAQPSFCFGSPSCSIDNSYVLTYTGAPAGLVLGLTATARCSGNVCGTPVTHSGNTFFATAGDPFAAPGLASWNFDFYADASRARATGYTFVLLYGLAGGPVGSWNLGTDLQDSDNLGFPMFTTGLGAPAGSGPITPPAGFLFDPNAIQQYNFTLEAFNANGSLAASVFECVTTGTVASACAASSPQDVTPEPATLSLMATGLVGLAGVARRRKRNR